MKWLLINLFKYLFLTLPWKHSGQNCLTPLFFIHKLLSLRFYLLFQVFCIPFQSLDKVINNVATNELRMPSHIIEYLCKIGTKFARFLPAVIHEVPNEVRYASAGYPRP